MERKKRPAEKRQKTGIGLSLALSLCLAVTGVAGVVPAIGALAEESEEVHKEVYTGAPLTPEITVLDDDGYVVPNEQLVIKYDNNTDVGTQARVTVYAKADDPKAGEGTYNYSFGKDSSGNPVAYTKTFTITPAANGVNITNENEDVMSSGEIVYGNKISGRYTDEHGNEKEGEDGRVSDTDIFVVTDEKWNGNINEDELLPASTAELTIPEDGKDFVYYVVVKNGTFNGAEGAKVGAGNGYYAVRFVISTSENATGFDTNTWYTYDDANTGILWNYKLNRDGDIVGLYTTSDIGGIINNGVLNVPAKINDRIVLKIGGDSVEHPFIKAGAMGWSSISFPSTLTMINDFAFYKNESQANVVIPSTITKIGDRAFYESGIKGLKILEMNGTIASAAFRANSRLEKVYIKSGASDLVISTAAFADNPALTDVTIKGNTKIHKKAFANNSGVATLSISGISEIAEYAFSGLTSLEDLYLPEGITLSPYSFNGATSLARLESNTNLVSNSFAACGKIEKIILDQNVSHVSYDWESNYNTITSRTIFVRNPETKMETRIKDPEYQSSFKARENRVTVYYNGGTDSGSGQQPTNDGVLALNPATYANHGEYRDYYNAALGSTTETSQVTFINTTSINQELDKPEHGGSIKDRLENLQQDGIEAYYNGKILTTQDIDKNKMTVYKVSGNNEIGEYGSDEFYIVRTTEYETEIGVLELGENLSVDNITKYEPVHAYDDDLKGEKNGVINVTVVVFDDNAQKGHYNYTVPIRVESYSAKTDVEERWGSYENIAKTLIDLNNQIDALKEALGAESTSKEDLEKRTAELNKLKEDYSRLVDTLAAYTGNANPGSGYFGTWTDPDTGEQENVIYIDGNPVPYEVLKDGDTEITNNEGKKVYEITYDVDGDGESEKINVVVDTSGVHQVEVVKEVVEDPDTHETTVETTVTDTGKVWSDTVRELENRAAAQLAAMSENINDLHESIDEIKNAIGETIGETDKKIEDYEGATEAEKIANAVKALANKNAELATELDTQKENAGTYSDAIGTIYNKLTGETITAGDTEEISGAIDAITKKIDSDKEELTKMQSDLNELTAQAATLQERIDAANATNTALEGENADLKEANEKDKEALTQAQNTLTEVQGQIAAKNTEIENLNAQLDSYKNSAEGYKMTAETANQMFGFSLKAGDSIENAIKDYVKTKTENDKTIKDIQTAVGSAKTGDGLVEDVKAKITSGGSGSGTSQGGSSGTADQTALTAKYNEGFAAGVASVDTTENGQTYKNGYNAGYVKGVEAGKNGVDNTELTQQIESLNGQVQTLSNENAALKTNVTTLQTENSSLNTKVNELSASNGTLQGQVDTLSASNNDLQGKVDGLNTANSDLQGQVDTLNSTNSSLQGQVSDLRGKNTSLNNDVARLNTQISTLRSQSQSNGSGSGSGSGSSSGSGSASQSSNGSGSGSQGTGQATTTPVNTTKPTTTASSAQPQVQTTTPTSQTSANSSASSSQSAASTVSSQNPAKTIDLDLIGMSGVDETQKTVVLGVNRVGANGTLPTGNVKSVKLAGANAEDNAIKVAEYYANNTKELKSLGLKTVDPKKDQTIMFDEIFSVDVAPTDAQEASIKKGEKVNVQLKTPDAEDGEYYLMVHESEKRAGKMDVAVVQGKSGSLSMTVSDLSPVTAFKITVADNTAGTATGNGGDKESGIIASGSNSKTLMSKLVLPIIMIAGISAGAIILVIILMKKKARPAAIKQPGQDYAPEDYDDDGEGYDEVDEE